MLSSAGEAERRRRALRQARQGLTAYPGSQLLAEKNKTSDSIALEQARHIEWYKSKAREVSAAKAAAPRPVRGPPYILVLIDGWVSFCTLVHGGS